MTQAYRKPPSRWNLLAGDALEMLRTLPDNHFDGLLSDVPYGLGSREPSVAELVAYLLGTAGMDTGGDFMGKEWQIPPVSVWVEIFRVLKPGAHLLVFAGSRTQDLVTIGMRAGGFEIRDCLFWMYGSGFPKSLDVERAVAQANCTLPGRHYFDVLPRGKLAKPGDHACPQTAESVVWIGTGTALKPAFEPCVLARKPLDGTVAENVQRWGTGALAIDACRIGEFGFQKPKEVMAAAKEAGRDGAANVYGSGLNAPCSPEMIPGGRFPANVIFSHADECRMVGNVEAWECVDGCPIKILDEQSGRTRSGIAVTRNGGGGRVFHGIAGPSGHRGYSDNPRPDSGYSDSGCASRYFYVAKASRAERELGCELLPARTGSEAVEREQDSAGTKSPRAGAGRTAEEVRNHGPCVKPIKLTRYLATLILPPVRPAQPLRLLVPYCGTGSEIIGASRAGWDEIVGIEREPEYLAIARARVARSLEAPLELDEGEIVTGAAAASAPEGQATLF